MPTRTAVVRRWLVPTKTKPKLIWEDSGTGGRRGSFWTVNNMDTLIVTEGPPARPSAHPSPVPHVRVRTRAARRVNVCVRAPWANQESESGCVSE